jgi:uncharacterized protein DUF5362
MEENQNYQDNSLFDLSIDETAKNHLRSLATWGMVIVISAVIGYVLAIIKALQTKPQGIQSEGFGSSFTAGGNLGGAIFGIVIGLLVNYFLFQFANHTKRGINGMSQADLDSGFYNLKIYFAIIGVLLIIVLVIAFLVILVLGLSAH